MFSVLKPPKTQGTSTFSVRNRQQTQEHQRFGSTPLKTQGTSTF
jgi:hypothetical protein